MSSRPSLALSLPALRTYEAVVRLGSLEAAARELFLTVSAISHQLKGLEAAFGRGLMRKQGRRMVATEVGTALAAELGPAFRTIDRAVAQARGARPVLTVSVHPAFAAHWLLPRLPRLEASMQDVDLRLATTARVMDLDKERVDCAIRLGPGRWPGVDAHPLAAQREAPVANARLFDAVNAPRILLEGYESEWDQWPDMPAGTPGRIVQSRELLVDAVIAGAGVGLVDMLVASDAIARGELRVLRPPRHTGWHYCLVTPKGRTPTAAVESFRDWLLSEFMVVTQ